MKTLSSLICLAAFAAVLPSFGAEPFKAPDFVKEFKDLKQAQKEAADSNKGVTFLLMEPGST